LHYSKIENWGCVLYTGAHYIQDFTVICEFISGPLKLVYWLCGV